MKTSSVFILAITLAATSAAQDIAITRAGSQPVQKTPAENFTGTVRVERLFSAAEPARATGGLVTFEAGLALPGTRILSARH